LNALTELAADFESERFFFANVGKFSRADIRKNQNTIEVAGSILALALLKKKDMDRKTIQPNHSDMIDGQKRQSSLVEEIYVLWTKLDGSA
jgi:hypothetical protein